VAFWNTDAPTSVRFGIVEPTRSSTKYRRPGYQLYPVDPCGSRRGRYFSRRPLLAPPVARAVEPHEWSALRRRLSILKMLADVESQMHLAKCFSAFWTRPCPQVSFAAAAAPEQSTRPCRHFFHRVDPSSIACAMAHCRCTASFFCLKAAMKGSTETIHLYQPVKRGSRTADSTVWIAPWVKTREASCFYVRWRTRSTCTAL